MNKTVFLTGATGHMGFEVLKLLCRNSDFKLKILSLPGRVERNRLKTFAFCPNIEIIEGDLRSIDDVRRGVKGADYVLHIGALIPPVADRYPVLAGEINLGGTLNIIKAIKEQNNPDETKLVYIASVASMGNRPSPIHWCRAGDPIKVSEFDAYGVSKVKAERAVIESGLKYWVSIRQSGMLHEDMFKIIDPIIFHQPLNNHIEWSTAEDSGRALYNICVKDLPDVFWRNVYNLGSGPEFRETFYDFIKTLFARIGVSDIQKFFRPKDFTLKNFHCVWYSDSDKLNNWLDFRRSTYSGFLKKLHIPSYYHLLRLIPGWFVRKFIILPLSRKAEGTRNWIENNIAEKIKAYWGSLKNWENIPESWDDFRIERVPEMQLLEHGWDEKLSLDEIGIDECREAALFRGGKCLSYAMNTGDIYTGLIWRCAIGHDFELSPNAVLQGGHWCPECDTDVNNYQLQSEKSMFFGQVY